MTDSDEVLVASTQVGETTASTSAKTCCLTLSSSNTASMTKSASANSSLLVDPVTRALSRLARSRADAPLGQERVDLAVDVGEALVDPLLVEVGDDDRHLEPLREQQGELTGHQTGADDRRPW